MAVSPTAEAAATSEFETAFMAWVEGMPYSVAVLFECERT